MHNLTLDIGPTAFIGGIEMSLPSFGGEGGICEALEDTVGNIREANPNSTWTSLISSGCRTATEFSESWNLLQQEARECSNYLGNDLEGAVAADLLAAGNGRMDGSTRSVLTEEREKLRRKVLTRALELHPDQTARPVCAIPQFDKLSQAWLLSLPNPTTYLAGPVFREAMAAHLCLPSPCCQSKVGQPVGQAGARVDPFGVSCNQANTLERVDSHK